MFRGAYRRLAVLLPLLAAISVVIFLITALAPNDPTAQLPLSIPPELRAEMREALGLGEPLHIRYLIWAKQFFIHEPTYFLEQLTGWTLQATNTPPPRLISWSAQIPVAELIAQRLPQTLWVVGLSYVLGLILALPIALLSAHRPHGLFDRLAGAVTMTGFAMPSFFTGVVLILIFSVSLGWFPSVYDTTHRVTDLSSFGTQLRQMVLPVTVLALYNMAQIARYMRAALLEQVSQDYVRTARAKGAGELRVMIAHVARNAALPVVTVIALGVPQVFTGAIITEQIFRVNGIGHLLISGIQTGDVPLVQSLSFLFAVLIVICNLLADIAYGWLDPRLHHG